MSLAGKHSWAFTSRFRRNAYGWRGSSLAVLRLKEAVSEIKKAARKDPVLGAVRIIFSPDSDPGAYFKKTTACFSALHKAGRYEEIMAFLRT